MVKDDVCGLVVVGLRTTKASTSLIMAATRQIQKNLIVRKSLSNQDPKNNNNYSLGVRLLLRNRSLLNRVCVCVCQGFSTSEEGVTHPSDPTVRTRTNLRLYTVYTICCIPSGTVLMSREKDGVVLPGVPRIEGIVHDS